MVPPFYYFNRSAAHGAPRYGTTGYEYVGLACTRVTYFLRKYLVLRHLFFGLPWVGRIRKAKNKAAGLSQHDRRRKPREEQLEHATES